MVKALITTVVAFNMFYCIEKITDIESEDLQMFSLKWNKYR